MAVPPASRHDKPDTIPIVQGFAQPDAFIDKVFSLIPRQAGFVVEMSPRTDTQSDGALLANRQGWGKAHLTPERLDPAHINALLEQHGIPRSFDCLVLHTGSDFQAWDSLDSRYMPSLVVATFDPHIASGSAAVQAANTIDSSVHNASLPALCALASLKGYRPIQISTPCNAYLLRNDISFPSELTVKPNLTQAELDELIAVGPKKAVETEPDGTGTASASARCASYDSPEPPPKTKRVDIGGVIVEVLADKNDGNWYLQRKTFEEKASLLYPFIREEGFATFVDVGANYGFVSMLARRAAPALKIIAIEADPRLARLVEANFLTNKLTPPTVIHAIAGDRSATNSQFSLNPTSTLDNRVDIAQWEHVSVPMVTVDEVIDLEQPTGKIFFKIDTQGFELHVLHGMEAYLSSHADWALKMEFAPNWLASQGTQPLDVLSYLQQRYQFAEYQERIPFGTPNLDALFATPITADRHDEFLDYVKSLNKGDLGWVDLIVRPKPLPSRH